jgi:hypothetical protein
LHESAFGPKRTSVVASHMSAFGVIADIGSRPVTYRVGGLFTLRQSTSLAQGPTSCTPCSR